MKGTGPVKEMLGSPPLRALSLKGKGDGENFKPKEGYLYRLQGVVGDFRKPVSYYFFLVNRNVVSQESAASVDDLKYCKAIGDLEDP
jgi:hypothetical protein